MALDQHVRTQLLLGRKHLSGGDPFSARKRFENALTAPLNLGEAKHLLKNQSNVHYWLGVACSACGDKESATSCWACAANAIGDFQAMEFRSFSEMTYYSAMALRELGRREEANKLFGKLRSHSLRLMKSKARIDYFATSLPTLLLFEEDIDRSKIIQAKFLKAQAAHGLGKAELAAKLCEEILVHDPSHAAALDFLQEARTAIR